MNKKTIMAFIIGFAFMGAGSALAHTATSADATSTLPTVAVADTLPSAGLTPLSPFYFLDRFGDWARVNFFFFNPLKRAEVATEVANERLAELKEVSEKDPQRKDVIERLENDVVNRIDKAHGALERFNAENKKAGPLLKKMENLSLNSQRVMENMLLKDAPKKIKERTEKSLKNIYEFAKKRQAILMKQKEKGLISGAEVEKLMNERMERMKRQIERRSERIDKIENPVLKEKLKGIMSEKLNLLEDTIFSTESMGEDTSIGKRVRAIRRGAIRSILQARKRMMLRGATTTDEALQDMYEGKIDFKERSADLIEKATENISEIKVDLGKMGTTTPKIVRAAEVLLVTADRNLTAAEKAFEAEKYRVAFGLAMSAVRSSRAAEKILERRDDIREGFEHMDRGQGEKLRKEMETRREGIRERSERGREILKNRMEGRGENGVNMGKREDMMRRENGENGQKEGVACSRVYNPVCGENGKTYSNKCVAENENKVEVKHKGRCSLKEMQMLRNRVKELKAKTENGESE